MTPDLPSISVITWDGGFRESFHTVTYYGQLKYPTDKRDLVWVEYSGDVDPALRETVGSTDGARLITLGREGQWHVARCMNEGLRASQGELCVLIDGDVVMGREFLHEAVRLHDRFPRSAIYARRWDVSEDDHADGWDVDHLRAHSQPSGTLNYGGCLTIRRELLESLGMYETHPVFGGPGAVSGELAVRITNAGIPIVWPPEFRVFHPWHPGTLPSTATDQQLAQRHVIRMRNRHVDMRADRDQVSRYLESFTPPPRVAGRIKNKLLALLD